jgi:hypothetical protein
MNSICQMLLCGILVSTLSAAADPVTIEVLPEIQTQDLPRIGLNLGERSVFGGAQLIRNILLNPGFEGQIDRTVVIVAHATAQGFDDDMSWSGRPDGFWVGARFDVRSGASAGQSGIVSDSRKRGEDGLPTFATRDTAPALAAGDAIILTRIDDQNLPTTWTVPRDTPVGQVMPELKDKRPGSLGKRSLALIPLPNAPKRFTPPARVTAYFDSIGNRAGKLLPIDGRWKFTVWARSEGGQGNLRANFQRQGSQPFLRETVRVPSEWKLIEFQFDGTDKGPPGVLSLELAAEDGKVLLDDASLEPMAEGSGAFRREVVEALEKLKPGYLRDWQGQLGDTFENLIATPDARRSDRYRPGNDDRWGYSLPEFLDLCKKVGANPWVILPTTFNDSEYEAFGRYLADRIKQDGFTEAVAEFGNENWNGGVFRSGGFPNPHTHGLVAQRAFANFKKGAGPQAPIRLTVNGQHVNPDYALKMLDSAPDANMLAVAPYVLHHVNRSDFTDEPWDLLFKTDPYLPVYESSVLKRKKELAVYEVNFHTTGGDLAPDLREQIVTGAASGSGLAKRMLESVNAGVRRQCVYNLAQYDFSLPDRNWVKLWGIMRDLGPTQRMRPTGLALLMLNSALPGEAHALRMSGPNAESLTAAAFLRKDGWSLAVVSASAQATEVSIKFPPPRPAPSRLLRLDAASPSSSNENTEEVRIAGQAITAKQPIKLTLPPWGFLVLTH